MPDLTGLPRTIDTGRLLLRPPELADAPVMFNRWAQDPEATRYLSWSTNTQLEQTEAFVRGCVEAWQGDGRRVWLLTQKPDLTPIGIFDATFDGHQVTVGYGMAQAWWRQGYMTEAASALVALLLALPEVFRVWAYCDVDNQASYRLMERIGMQREGVLRQYAMHPNLSAQARDAYCYSLVR